MAKLEKCARIRKIASQKSRAAFFGALQDQLVQLDAVRGPGFELCTQTTCQEFWSWLSRILGLLQRLNDKPSEMDDSHIFCCVKHI
jgi:hypothetical protein